MIINVPPEELDAWMARIEAASAKRAADMPTDKDALDVLHDAWLRLKELGWNEAIYCPKDGTLFHAIEAGSTGIHDFFYSGEWPNGTWFVVDKEGDMWPSRPILWKPIDAALPAKEEQ